MKSRARNNLHFNFIDHEDLDLAISSLHSIAYLGMSSFERTYWHALDDTVQCAYDRPIEAYISFVKLYNIPSCWIHDEFQSFINPYNSVAQILQAHFIAIQAILTPILYLERIGFEGANAPTLVMSWIQGIYKNLPRRLRRYVEWPKQVSEYPFMHFLGQRNLVSFDEQAELSVSEILSL